ncbi:hypothetical protein BJ878DRAFT_585208 [Calycina marina]|uniref:MYND-type domain-containing protein n=1 Tax=Calycina marina TaxID=1763456 RepID=A0A9P7YV78_9HELO|nr:hypothetical protein BJ878DRAFT_585208 [Calycina marina]
MSSESESEILDLYQISLLLTYERGTTEPRFRHAKLREEFDDNRPLTTYIFDRDSKYKSTKLDMTSSPDLPSEILPLNFNENDPLNSLTTKELDTALWQARGYDGCYKSVTLLQHFFDLYPRSTQIRICHGPKGKALFGLSQARGDAYVTELGKRVILEMTLVQACQSSLSSVCPENMTYISGESKTMLHAVFGFASPGAENCTAFLDLSSMQFGDVGRRPGLKGQGIFALDTFDEFNDRMDSVAHGMSPHVMSNSKVAEKVKKRWENRKKEKCCGHCGAPLLDVKTCTGCLKAWYCNKEHQKLAWYFHRQYCTKD